MKAHKHISKSLMLLGMIWSSATFAQEAPKKFTLTGAARGVLFGDELKQDIEDADTITAPRLNSGHALVDLGMSVRPNKNMEVFGMLRVRNDFGGFWGSGTTFDVRQLYVRGVAGGKVRYQIGDINYKLTPYTLYNYDQELSFMRPNSINTFAEIIEYDNFYNFSNSWRQQGAAADFGLQFRKYIREMNFNVFSSRVRPTNFSSQDERLFSAINVGIVQSEYFAIGYTYTNLFDWSGTSRSTTSFRNPVNSVMLSARYPMNDFDLSAKAELGNSHQFYRSEEDIPEFKGNFMDAEFTVANAERKLRFSVGFKNVESGFRSPGAQTKRVNFESVPASYRRITNDQMIRTLTMYDLLRESNLYNLQLSTELMAFNPAYDNITPYGEATPNRSGMRMRLDYGDSKSAATASAAYHMLEETRGQGTENFRQFSRLELAASLKIDRWIPSHSRRINLDLGMRMDNTSRDSEEGVQAVDLSTNVISLGLAVETAPDLDVIAGIQVVTYSGFDFLAVRNNEQEVVYFNEFETDGQEQMISAGLMYHFSDTDRLSIQYAMFDASNTKGILPDYRINQLSFLYTMNF